MKAYHPVRGWITDPAEISFEVAPLWWQTIWAIGGAILLLACAIVGAWRWRVRVLVAQKNALAKAVNQRTAEIRAEKGTVEQQKKQIEDLLAEAQRVNRLKDEFLANISHEIRTPLHGVLGMTGLALTTPLSEEQREYLQLAEQSAQSLLHLLNDILDFSKIQAGKLNLQHIPFSLRDCIERSTGALSLVAQRKGLEFRVLLADDLPETVLGDPDRLQQILSNLTNNAVKFTDRGRIQVLGFRDPKPEFKDRIHFSVRDTGQGIPRDKWQVVFEPFRQADGSTTRRFGGTGLGLSICSRLVEQMDGQLTLDSETGIGSTFSFAVSLPELELPEFDSADVKKPAVDLQPLKVLLIEANEVNLKVGMRQLDRQGCAVTTVPTGMDALELLGEIDFDLIVMDLQLAGMDGLDLIRKIRLKERSAKRTPVIVLTSAVSTVEEQSVLKAGADAYLSRPVQAVDLRRVLEASATQVRRRPERPPQAAGLPHYLLSFDRMQEYSIGVDMGGTNLRAAAIDGNGKNVDKISANTRYTAGRDAVMTDIVLAIQTVRSRVGAGELLGVGIGIPGYIQIQTGVVIGAANLPGFEGFPVRDEIQKRLGTTIILENDANAAALGEKWMGAGRDVDELLLVTLGTGIGGGIIIGGRVLHGFLGMAGELGHVDGCSRRESMRVRQLRVSRKACFGDSHHRDGAYAPTGRQFKRRGCLHAGAGR